MMWCTKRRKIFIAQYSIDFRKGAEGLLAECYSMEIDPYEGDCVVFLHRSRRMLKIIGGDDFGLWVLVRRFEGGAMGRVFRFLDKACCVPATQGEVAMLLEGTTFEVKSKVKAWKSAKKTEEKVHRSRASSWKASKI